MKELLDRFNDLNKQGFMKSVYCKPKRNKRKIVIIACDKCHDWHEQGKHLKSKNTMQPEQSALPE